MWKGNRVYVKAIESLFERDEAQFSEATYFDELAKDGEVAVARP